MAETNRIKFALHSQTWTYDPKDRKKLRETSREVPTSEYLSAMKGHIFCPECCVPLFRSPEEKEYDAKGRKAFYSHRPKFDSNCNLRVKQAEGKHYENEEQAKQAIENGELVVVQGFLKDKPKPPEIKGPVEYKGPVVEDEDGPLTEVAIGRHDGEEFKLPGRITTIRGLCRNFDKNIYRYFYFPNYVNAILLSDLLIDIRTVTEVDETPRLYYAKISSSRNMGKTPKNIRQTFFEYPKRPHCPDFCLKITDELSQEHGINDDSKGRYVLMYGPVVESGVGLCLKDVGWGEFAILPAKYDYLLDE
jgi:hypothetical protein